jgi:hypothetical protein
MCKGWQRKAHIRRGGEDLQRTARPEVSFEERDEGYTQTTIYT